MRIISLNYELQDTCKVCKCNFAYNPKDIEYEDTTQKYFVRCPNCTKKLYVDPPQWFVDKYNEYVKGLNKISPKMDF